MIEMKYIVVESEECGKQLIIFPKNIDHDRMAEALSVIRHGDGRNWSRIYRNPISAGFTDGVKCYGESTSLKIKSNASDTDLLKGICNA
jgi:hypothetical protein